MRLSARNSVYLNYKNMPLPQLALNFLPLCAGYAVKYFFFVRLGFGGDYLDGIREGISTRKKCKKVYFRGAHIRNYLRIEADLWRNTLTYAADFLRRHAER